jgi:UDP-N-acetylmuramate dehydrogenase
MTSPLSTSIDVKHDVSLSSLTTIGLGGNARYFVACRTVDHIHEALKFSHARHLRTQVLGGGSNVLFSDEGFNGLVCRIELQGISLVDQDDDVVVTVAAGEEWDSFVQQCITKHLAGVECLSGIPGFVGATPIQNVGAYGQDVRDSIVSVKAMNRTTLEVITFSNSDCRFGYRQSRFKAEDIDRYVITEVAFKLRKYGRPEIRYPELQKFIASTTDLNALADGEPALRSVRDAVLTLRRRKSMVVDSNDPNARSVGSFFMNPTITADRFAEVRGQWEGSGAKDEMPTYPAGDKVKLPAAWLVEQAGFPRGYRRGRVGVSQNHSLALVNYGGTTRELLDLATQIQDAVRERFGIILEREPVVIPP